MRINKLAVAGFGPYKTRQVVDFDAFADDGIFLISGKTGAGKSSILDAICFALYNHVPRFEGTEKQLRSHHADLKDPSFVELEFTIAQTRYRVKRTPEYERPNKRGEGTTTQKAEVELFSLNGETWEGMAARATDVGHELTRILGLSRDQFLQVILLAQNRFQEFLLAKNDERQAVLQTLFGSERFADYEKAIVERAKELSAELVEAIGQRDRDAERAASLSGAEPEDNQSDEWFALGLKTLKAQQKKSLAAAAKAREAFDTADAAHKSLLDLITRQQRRNSARADLAKVENERELVAAKRIELTAATKAEIVAPQLEELAAATVDEEAAATAVESSRQSYGEFGPRDSDSEALKAAIEKDSRTLGTLEEFLVDEAGLPALAKTLVERDRDVASATVERDVNAARVAELPALIKTVADALTATRVEAGGLDAARATVDRVRAQRGSADEAARLVLELQQSLAAESEASSGLVARTLDLDDFVQRRFHGFAGELAARLVAGQPCEVCGSTAHPDPAAASDDPVTEEDIKNAHKSVGKAKWMLDEASTAARALEQKASTAAANAGTATAEELTAAEKTLKSASDAAARSVKLEAENSRLVGEQQKLSTASAALQEKLQLAELAKASASEKSTTLNAKLEKYRGDFASVGERATSLKESRAAANLLIAAIANHDGAAKTLGRTNKTLQAQLKKQGFATVEEVSAARRTSDASKALAESIRNHENNEAIAKATLAEPDLVDLPDELVSIDTAVSDRAQSSKLLDVATAESGSITEKHGQYVKLLAEVKVRAKASAVLRAEHAELESLAAAVQGKGANTRRMRLETYVLAAQLEEIVAAANVRLGTMTGGRYELQHSDALQKHGARSGLGLQILDQHTGRSRVTHSLSGGETFLASLALALGLAEVVTNQSGGITLDTLFVDEGFGSLDGDTLEIAMSTLDSLRSGGRTIGLISHVEAMKEQIPAKLAIRVVDGGWSEIVQGGA